MSDNEKFSDKIILKPNSLRNLAGISEDVEDSYDVLDYINEDEFFRIIGTEAVSVEIMTLSQYRYEIAFDYVMTKHHSSHMSIDEMTDMVEKNVSKFKHLTPIVKIEDFGILVVVDVKKIDAKVVDYVSSILAKLPNSTSGFEWNYLEEE